MGEDERDDWHGTRRVLVPPHPVIVRLPRVLPPQRIRHDDVPLRVRAGGLNNAAHQPGLLLAWHLTATGDWWALVRMDIGTRTGHAQLRVTQLVPASAVSTATS